jgi:hypothetical protein
MVLYLSVLIMFLLHRELLKLILVDEPLPEVVLSQSWTWFCPKFAIEPLLTYWPCQQNLESEIGQPPWSLPYVHWQNVQWIRVIQSRIEHSDLKLQCFKLPSVLLHNSLFSFSNSKSWSDLLQLNTPNFSSTALSNSCQSPNLLFIL